MTDFVSTADGVAVLTEPVANAISLSRLLDARFGLEPGEIVTVGLPMAQALAAMHEVGVTHGQIVRENILLEPNGRPVLTGGGLTGLVGFPASPSSDVHDLARLLVDAIAEATGPDSASVVVALALALASEPRRRPSASALAASLAVSCTPAPIKLISDAEPSPMIRQHQEGEPDTGLKNDVIFSSSGRTLAASAHRYRIFLCHSHADKAEVRILYRRLRDEGFDPWFDENDLLPGQDWSFEIRKAMRASRIVLVCLSASSVTKSGYVQKEIRLALDIADEQPEGSIYLIPVRLEPCNVPDRLSRWQWVDSFIPSGYKRLLLALRQSIP